MFENNKQEFLDFVKDIVKRKINKPSIDIHNEQNLSAGLPITPKLEDIDPGDLKILINDAIPTEILSDIFEGDYQIYHIANELQNVDNPYSLIEYFGEIYFANSFEKTANLIPIIISKLKEICPVDDDYIAYYIQILPTVYAYVVKSDLLATGLLFLIIATIIKFGDKILPQEFQIKKENLFEEVSQKLSYEYLKNYYLDLKLDDLIPYITKVYFGNKLIQQYLQKYYHISYNVMKQMLYLFKNAPELLTDLFRYTVEKKGICYESILSDCIYSYKKYKELGVVGR